MPDNASARTPLVYQFDEASNWPRTMTTPSRYSKLSPLPIEEKIRLSLQALEFFLPINFHRVSATLGRKTTAAHAISPWNAGDFINYLEKTGTFPDAQRHMFRIVDLLSELASGGILSAMGPTQNPLTGQSYYFMREQTAAERKGVFWLAPALGPQFIHHLISSITEQVTGTDSKGDARAGTALVISPNWLLTCAHVISDMEVDAEQTLQGQSNTVVDLLTHKTIDVGLIKVSKPLIEAPGLLFSNPSVAQTVYTLGFPRIPLSRSSALIMHKGEVTSEHLTTFQESALFLYSAIARPGNSGGPIVASSGHVVGIVTDELSEEAARQGMPFYAGVRTSEIVLAVSDLNPDIALPVETYM